MIVLLFSVILSVSTGASALYYTEIVPMLAWTKNSAFRDIEPLSLSVIRTEELSRYLRPVVENKMRLVVFVDKFLAAEDFILQDDGGKGVFKNMQDNSVTKNFIYFPKVERSVSAIHNISKMFSLKNVVYNISGEPIFTKTSSDSHEVVLIHMESSFEDKLRANVLKDHDKIMHDIAVQLKNYDKILYVYTGLIGVQFEEFPQLMEDDYDRQKRDVRRGMMTIDDHNPRLLRKLQEQTGDPPLEINDPNPPIVIGEFCIPFPRTGAFVAYFAVGILLCVLALGVGMLQSIKACDRFDGPEQKVLLRE